MELLGLGGMVFSSPVPSHAVISRQEPAQLSTASMLFGIAQ